jgi:hypothetical protein
VHLQQTCCDKTGKLSWACANKAQGDIKSTGCTSFSNATSGSPGNQICTGVASFVVQQKAGASGLTIFIQDGSIKANFNATGTSQCGSTTASPGCPSSFGTHGVRVYF